MCVRFSDRFRRDQSKPPNLLPSSAKIPPSSPYLLPSLPDSKTVSSKFPLSLPAPPPPFGQLGGAHSLWSGVWNFVNGIVTRAPRVPTRTMLSVNDTPPTLYCTCNRRRFDIDPFLVCFPPSVFSLTSRHTVSAQPHRRCHLSKNKSGPLAHTHRGGGMGVGTAEIVVMEDCGGTIQKRKSPPGASPQGDSELLGQIVASQKWYGF